MALKVEPNSGTMAPKMGANLEHEQIGSALFGKTRRGVLSLLYGHPDESFYVRQIARWVGAGQGAVQRELKRLSQGGVIRCSRRGRQVFYQANPGCPVYAELQGLILKTAGLADVLRDALERLGDKIKVAFVYGSMAGGGAGAASDVDLIVVGKLKFGEVVSALAEAQRKLSREVNPTVYPPEEFHQKVASDHHFLKTVLSSPKIFLVGDESELARVGGVRLANGT